jgi:molybdopterin converting factor small subunit
MPTTIHIHIRLFYHLKEKAGIDHIELDVNPGVTIADLKNILETRYPSLRTHLDNIMVLMDRKIVLDDDLVIEGAEISFLTPVGGG